MKINKRKLISLNACEVGLVCFNHRFPRGCDLSNKKTVWEWLRSDGCSYRTKAWLIDMLVTFCMVRKNFEECRADFERLNPLGQELFQYLHSGFSYGMPNPSALDLNLKLMHLSWDRLVEATVQISKRLGRS